MGIIVSYRSAIFPIGTKVYNYVSDIMLVLLYTYCVLQLMFMLYNYMLAM